MPTYKLDIEVNGHDNNASSVLLNVQGGLGSLGVAMGNLISHGIERLGAALWDLGKKGLGVATDYQSSLNMFQAVSGATADQMARVASEAKTLGGDMTLPATSAGDAARAMTELAKAGLTVNDALLAGKGTLQLAAAGAIDEAQAAEIAANALNSFGLSGDKAMMVADLFAAAANKSSLEVTDVADGFKMASAVFSAFQGPVVGSEKALKDLTTAMALLGNVGIKGSDAGTSLKQMLLQLTGPSANAKDEMKGLMYAAMGAAGGMEGLDKIIGGKAKDRSDALGVLAKANPSIADMGDIAYDAAGKMRPLQDIIKLVSAATKGMTDETRNQALTTIFGADATRAIIGLMRAGPDAFNEMEAAISQQGAASELAGAQMKGLGGAWEGFQSTLETTLLTLTEPLLGPLETGVRAAADALSAATPALLNFLTTGLLPAISAGVQFVATFGAAPDKLAFLLTQFDGLGASFMAALPGWLGTLKTWGLAAGQWALDAIPGLLLNLLQLRNQAVAWVLGEVPGWMTALEAWGPALWQWIITAGPKLLGSFGGVQLDLLTTIGNALPAIATKLEGWAGAFLAWIGPMALNLIRDLGPVLDGMGTWIKDTGAPWLGQHLDTWATQFFIWVGPAGAKLMLNAGALLGELLTWITARTPAIAETFGGWIHAAGVWFGTKGVPLLLEAVGTMGVAVIGKIQQLWAGAFAEGSLGEALITSIQSGIEANWAKLTGWFSQKWQGFVNGIGLGGGAPAAGPSSSGGGWGAPATGGSSSSGGDWGAVPAFAGGVTNFAGGLALVGERGPELLRLPGGSDVIPAGSFGLPSTPLGGGGGGGNFTWTGDLIVQGVQDPAATARIVREEFLRLKQRTYDTGIG